MVRVTREMVYDFPRERMDFQGNFIIIIVMGVYEEAAISSLC